MLQADWLTDLPTKEMVLKFFFDTTQTIYCCVSGHLYWKEGYEMEIIMVIQTQQPLPLFSTILCR